VWRCLSVKLIKCGKAYINVHVDERRLVITSGIVLGEDLEDGIGVRLSELRQALSRRISDPDAVITKLAGEGLLRLERVGGGYRVIIKYMPEVRGIYSFIINPTVTTDDFVRELNNAITKYANPATGYADLGLVVRQVCGKLGISESEFDQMLIRVLRANGRRYVLSYGGSHRVKVGSGYYGLIKVVS
jgi:hypothetical protein